MRNRAVLAATLLWLAALPLVVCGGSDDSEEGSGDAVSSPAPAATSGRPLATLGTAATSAASTSSQNSADWKRLSASGIEIWLPPSYEGGDPTKGDLDAIVSALRSSGNADFAATLDAARSAVQLLMIDNDLSNLGTSVNAVKVSVPSALGLDAIVQLNLQQLPAGVQVHDRRSLTVGGQPAVRVTADVNVGVGTVREWIYLVKSGNGAWGIVYAAPVDIFERNTSVFEESARRIRFN
jgi:serine/threonine-protein kinase